MILVNHLEKLAQLADCLPVVLFENQFAFLNKFLWGDMAILRAQKILRASVGIHIECHEKSIQESVQLRQATVILGLRHEVPVLVRQVLFLVLVISGENRLQ